MVETNSELCEEEVATIFIAHKSTLEGEIRTRRLFSTLNRYAVPINISERIALDEEDNSAILTRLIMEEFEYFKNKIKFSKTRSISPNDNTYFTNIVLLYDLITIILTNKSFSQKIKFDGYDFKKFTTRRESEDFLNNNLSKIKEYFIEVLESIPSVKKYFLKGELKRNKPLTNLIFRPIGQLIVFYVLKTAKQFNKRKKALSYFGEDTFNLSNASWKRIFIDSESNTIRTDKPRQILAIQLILRKLGIEITMTKKEKALMMNFDIDFGSL